jgi:capsular exopolysaccharide synthesis family protein
LSTVTSEDSEKSENAENADSSAAADAFFDGDDAEALLGIPTLGFLPRIDEPGLRLIRDLSSFSPLTEAFRALRTNLYFSTDTPLRSLAVVSSVPAEGKSTTAANLAMALALDGKRVILVDADLRRPSQHTLFGIEAGPGLTEVLAGDRTVKNVLRQTAVPEVRVIPVGSPPPNPAELLGSGGVTRLLAELERHCDIVLLDTPPVLAVADAAIAASQVDGALLVIGYGKTPKTNAAQSVRLLSRSRARTLGSALNRIDGMSSGFYYGKYYVPSDAAAEETGAGDGARAEPSARRREHVARRSRKL